MFKSDFEQICKSLNANYKYEEIETNEAVHTTVYTHYVNLNYEENEILIEYEFGRFYIANISTQIINADKNYFFQLVKNSHFKLLFFRNKRSLEILTKSKNKKAIIEKILDETGIEKIAKETLFEPKISFSTKGSYTDVNMIFHLGFDNKEKSLLPVINFFKKLIDLLNS